jgi:hypothetical protein
VVLELEGEAVLAMAQDAHPEAEVALNQEQERSLQAPDVQHLELSEEITVIQLQDQIV